MLSQLAKQLWRYHNFSFFTLVESCHLDFKFPLVTDQAVRAASSKSINNCQGITLMVFKMATPGIAALV